MSKKLYNIYNILIALNTFSVLTVLIYYLGKADNLFFNFSAIIWYLLMFLNMAVCIHTNKSKLFRTVAMIVPVVLMFLTVMAVHSINNYQWVICEVLAILYFAYSVFHSWYLGNEKFENKEFKKPNIVIFVLEILLLALVLGICLLFSTRMTVVQELTMTSVVAFLSGMVFLFPILVASVGIGVIRRSKRVGLKWFPKVLVWVLAFTIVGELIPLYAAPNAINNANKEYVQTFGGQSPKLQLSLPKMVFGAVKSSYKVVYDQPYYKMAFTNKNGNTTDYELKYDMYKPTKESKVTPVLIKIHGSGGDKGSSNIPFESMTYAANGYTVFDIQYGNEKVIPSNDKLAENVCQFINYLYENKSNLNIDINEIFITGASRGGKMTIMSASAWVNNKYFDLYNKVKIKGCIVTYGFMEDIFTRTGDERIMSIDELSSKFPPILSIDTTNDGSVQGGYLLKGALLNYNVKDCNIELRYAMHSPDSNYYGPWGQMLEFYTLHFMNDMVNRES
jgi:hypothetical protein